MSQLDCHYLAQDKSEMMDCACSVCIETHMEKSVKVHLVLIKAELGFLETELRYTEAYWLMFLDFAQ